MMELHECRCVDCQRWDGLCAEALNGPEPVRDPGHVYGWRLGPPTIDPIATHYCAAFVPVAAPAAVVAPGSTIAPGGGPSAPLSTPPVVERF